MLGALRDEELAGPLGALQRVPEKPLRKTGRARAPGGGSQPTSPAGTRVRALRENESGTPEEAGATVHRPGEPPLATQLHRKGKGPWPLAPLCHLLRVTRLFAIWHGMA